MANPVGALRADLETNVAAFKADMNEAASAVDKTSGKMRQAGADANKQGAGFAKFGKELKGVFAVTAGVAVAAFITESLKGAVAAEEMSASLHQQFGAMGDSVETWAERTSKDLGRIDDELKESAFSFGKLFQKVVPTQGAAADMSETMTKLAVDLATFNRIPVSEATDALQKGLAGSTRGLKAFGILISEEEVKQKAVALGLARTTKEVSAQDKVLASYNLILEKTTNVQGAAAEGMETTAGKLRAFQAGIDSLSDNLGAILIPVLLEVVRILDLYASGIRTILGDTDDFVLGLQVGIGKLTGQSEHEIVKAFRDAHTESDELARAAKTNGGVIDEEFQGNAKTAAELAAAIRKTTQDIKQANSAVAEFGIPDNSSSIRVMTDLSDAWVKLSDNIQDQILTLKEKTDRTEDETNAIYFLQQALDGLQDKYTLASKAAETLFFAQGKLNDAKAHEAVQGINDATGALGRASGAFGGATAGQERMAGIERDLARERMRASTDLLEMEAARFQAIAENDDVQQRHLEGTIAAQQVYTDLLDQTSAKQISQQLLLQDAIDSWQSSADGAVGDFFKDLRDHAGDNGAEIAANLIRSISDQVLEQKATEAVEGLFGLLFGDQGKKQEVQTINAKVLNVDQMPGGEGGVGGLGGALAGAVGGDGGGGFFDWAGKALADNFGGLFAEGGTLHAGEWGIAGENGPEILRGGTHGLEVDADGHPGGRGDTTQNFIFPNANADSFRASRRQVAQVARRELSP